MKGLKNGLNAFVLVGIISATFASSALARLVNVMPEPSSFSLIGLSVVAAIVIYRIKRKK